MGKSKEVETFPLFLSENYKQIYDRSQEALDSWQKKDDSKENSKQPIEERKRAKGAGKLYRSSWLLEKLQQQQERRRKARGQKQAKKDEPAAEKKDTQDVKRPGAKGAKGGATKVRKEDQADLETLLEEMKEDIHWKDVELTEMRDELAQLRAQNQQLKVAHLEEKDKRQRIEGKQMKYITMKELLDCKGLIQDNTFFENKRSAKTSADSNFRKIIKEKELSNYKAALAYKYGMKWLYTVRERREAKQKLEFYGQWLNTQIKV